MGVSSIKKNFFYNSLYQVLIVIIPFISAPYISRVLGAANIGIQSYTASIQQYFILFSYLGTLTYGARKISISRDDTEERSILFWEIELLVIITTTISLIGWCVFLSICKEYKSIYLILTIGIISSAFDISWFFSGIEKFKLTSLRSMFFRVMSLICLFLFVKKESDLNTYVLITSLTTLLSNISLWPYLRHYLVKVDFRKLRIMRHLRETIVYFVPSIATSLYVVLDKTLLGYISADAYQSGYYQQAQKVLGLANSFVFTAINAVVEVRNSYLFSEKNYEEIKRKIEISFNYIFFMGIGVTFGIIGVAKTFVPLFFGPGYEPVVNLLYILSPLVLIIGVSGSLSSQYYTPVGKRNKISKFLITGSVINLILNLSLIPSFGAIGATIASLVAETVITTLFIINSDGFCSFKMLFRIGWKKIIAGCLMFILVFKMNSINIHPILRFFLQVSSGVAVYGIILLIIRDKWVCSTISEILGKVSNRIKENKES